MFLFVCVCGEDWAREKLSGRVQPGDRYMNLDVKEGVGGGGAKCLCLYVCAEETGQEKNRLGECSLKVTCPDGVSAPEF